MTPENKPPFIGVHFTSVYEAGRKNVELIEYWRKEKPFKPSFSLTLELSAEYLNIILHCSDPICIRTYEQIKYNRDKLEKWLRDNRFKKPYNFAHVLRNGENYEIALTLPERHKFTFKVQKINRKVGENFYYE
jgi:hypothetical protein